MLQRVWQMLLKEFIQIFRDNKMRMIVLVIPCLQMIVIGYAVTTDVKHVATAVFDLDRSPHSRDLTARFLASGYFDLVRQVTTPEEAGELIDRGTVTLVLHFQHGFSDDLLGGRTAQVQLIVDGTDSNTAGVLLGYANRILAQYSQEHLADRFHRLLGALRRPGEVQIESRAWFNENLESRNYFVPGVIVIVVTLVTLLLTSMSVVREKEIGTIEQIMVTPITSVEFILGKTIPFALIALLDVVLITLVGVFWFGVPIRGSLGLLLLGTGLYLLTMLGTGLLISTVSQTQQQAMMTTFLIFFPAMLLSGFVFPVANMPPAVQWLTYLNPLRYFLVVVRALFLKGIGLEYLWPPMAAMGAMGVAVMWLVVRQFRKTA